MSNDFAALAGWAMNPRAPIDQRLTAARNALEFYVAQQDQLQELLEHCEELAGATTPQPSWPLAYADVRDRLRVILAVDADPTETVGGGS